jgi:hypothetical protein
MFANVLGITYDRRGVEGEKDGSTFINFLAGSPSSAVNFLGLD